jgi:hypothetical protein
VIRYTLAAVAALSIAAPTLSAQAKPAKAASAEANESSWASRITVGLRAGTFRPAGNSEAFELFDRALTKGTDDLGPSLIGASAQIRVWRKVHVVAGFEQGDRTVGSQARVQPTGVTTPVQQQTAFDLTGVQYAGVQVQAWQWDRGASKRTWLRLHAGVGAGQAQYSLRQWGNFVDVTRLVQFTDDLRSTGSGSFAYASLAAEVPVTRWASVQADVRQQRGSAGMNGDYASFDKLDLGGRRFGVGVLVHPWR